MSRLAERLAPQLFGGSTYEPRRDEVRLSHQLAAVKAYMADGQWRLLSEISVATGAPQQSVSARLRDLKKRQFGNHQIERRALIGTRGVFEYRLKREESATQRASSASYPLGRRP